MSTEPLVNTCDFNFHVWYIQHTEHLKKDDCYGSWPAFISDFPAILRRSRRFAVLKTPDGTEIWMLSIGQRSLLISHKAATWTLFTWRWKLLLSATSPWFEHLMSRAEHHGAPAVTMPEEWLLAEGDKQNNIMYSCSAECSRSVNVVKTLQLLFLLYELKDYKKGTCFPKVYSLKFVISIGGADSLFTVRFVLKQGKHNYIQKRHNMHKTAFSYCENSALVCERTFWW